MSITTFEATIDSCSQQGKHEPHSRLSMPWRDSMLVQHTLWCLGEYDQQRQCNHVTVENKRGKEKVVDERPCVFGCTDPAHPQKRPGYASR